jgi:hypothetical protein
VATFRVGDRVECVDPAWGLVEGQVYTVIGLSGSYLHVEENSDYNNLPRDLLTSRFKLITKETNNMASINEAMNLELDADTQLLRRESIENADGSLTVTGEAILKRVLYLDNRKAVIAKVKEIVAARKAVGEDEEE